MNSFRARRVAALVCSFLAFGALLSAADVRVYVRYSRGQKGAAQDALTQAGAKTHHQFDDLDAVAASIPEQARAALARNPNVVLVEDDPVRGFLSQTVPYGIDMVQATDPSLPAAGATGAGIKIGVIDSGVFAGHEDLAGVAITGEPDFGAADQRTWYRDYLSHGTHVVGTIAAANNTTGVLGVSPGAVAIHMVKVFGDTGNWVYSSDLVAACRAAAAKGCKVISMSLGGATSSATEQAGLDDLYNNQGVLLIAAAGNDGTTAYSYPASYSSVVSVAAIDNAKVVASFSQKNDHVELAAPGVAVLSTVSYVESNSVTVGSAGYGANHIEFSGRGTVTGPVVYGGLGTSTNTAWKGKVVLLDRGTNSFYDKVRNVQLSKGLACIIANNASGNFLGTLGDGKSSTLPAVSISQEDGTVLKTLADQNATVASSVQQNANGYDYFDGTSMATPHVSGVAAVIWSAYPNRSNAQVRAALTSSAEDLGAPGRDTSYGFGLVRAAAALTALAQSTPPSPPPVNALTITSGPTATTTNIKQGLFEIRWTTDGAASSDVNLGGTWYNNSTLTTDHRRSFRGTKGATYTYYVRSTDAAGHTVTSAPAQFTLQ